MFNSYLYSNTPTRLMFSPSTLFHVLCCEGREKREQKTAAFSLECPLQVAMCFLIGRDFCSSSLSVQAKYRQVMAIKGSTK